MISDAVTFVQRCVEIRQTLTTGKLVCLVESPTDKKLYGEFFDNSKVTLIPTRGKPNLLELLRFFEQQVEYRVFGIADADADRIRGENSNLNNLFYTDYRDLEATIFFSKAFTKVIGELASPTKLAIRSGIRDEIRGVAIAYGVAHELSTKLDMAVSFDKWTVDSCFDNKTLKIDKNKFFNQFNGRASRNKLTFQKFQDCFQECFPLVGAQDDFAPGDYLHDALGLALRKIIGNKKKELVARSELEIHFRLAYEKAMFVETALHSDIATWCNEAHEESVWQT